MTPVDVAVIGYGPTGAALANLLALQGLRVAVIEREKAAYHLPRAVHFDGETMRIFQTIGIADELATKTRVNPGMRFVDAHGTLLMDWPRPDRIGPQGWHESFRLHQPDLEQLLRAALVARGSAQILTRHEVTGITRNDRDVTLTHRHRDTGAIDTLNARFVVGCDGAGSFTRTSIGSGMEDLGFGERWLVVDLLLRRPRPDLGDHTLQICDPARPMTYCRSPGIRRRWEITVHPDETAAQISAPAQIWKFLAPWITPEDATLERSAVYTFRSSLAQYWRQGRVMIAGDAAHLTPPFMGQGMCTGIRDAANLAWKLAACLAGADLELLDTYQAERAPHARSYIETAMRLGGLINALDRDAALEMAAQDGGQMKSIAPVLGQSALTTDQPPCGTVFPQITLSDGQRMDDVIGYRPALISRKTDSKPHTRLETLSAAAHPELVPILNSMKCDHVLIRPDRYILATSRTTTPPAIPPLTGWNTSH